MVETTFCVQFDNDLAKHTLQWLYLRLGISIHDVYRSLQQNFVHQKRIKADPTCKSNGPTQIAFALSFLTSALTLTYLIIVLIALDNTLVWQQITWINNIDQLRLALGLTCIVRILIVHAEVQTLVLNAGFFSYMFFYSFYKTWLDSEARLDQLFGNDDSETKSTLNAKLWPQTKNLYIAQKSAFFIMAAASIITYYAHVYRQATWKVYQAPPVKKQ